MTADVRALIGQAAARYGVNPDTLFRIAEIESGMNPAARNPRSSAGGLFQFIDRTAQQYGLQDRFDPVQAADAAARLLRDNQSHLRRALGRDATGAELYLAHQQGVGGAARLLANPGAAVDGVVGSAAAGLNGGRPGMTAGHFAQTWMDRFNRTQGQPQGQPQGAGPAPMPAASPSVPMAAPGASLAALYDPALAAAPPVARARPAGRLSRDRRAALYAVG